MYYQLFYVDGEQYGLYHAQLDKWMAPNKTPEFYDLSSGTLLTLRKRLRLLRVRMMDETVKAILIDECWTVREITASVCERLGISCVDEYSLQSELLIAAREMMESSSQKVLKKRTINKDGSTTELNNSNLQDESTLTLLI